MRTRGGVVGTLAFVLVAAVGVSGCKKPAGGGGGGAGSGSGSGNGAGTGSGSAGGTGPALKPIGMSDPFARLGDVGAKAINAGYAALKAKKFDDAQTAFAQVTTAVPDYTAGWYQQTRAAALAGKFADVANLWSEVLARDYVAYAGRLDKASDLKALRAAPEWAQVTEAEARYKIAYATGLTDGKKGVFFVARAHDADKVKNGKGEGVLVLGLHQEIYYYELATQRYRRLTETGGRVYGYRRSPNGQVIAFFTTTGLAPDGEQKAFTDPKFGSIDLATLTTTGPYKAPGQQPEISFIGADEPVLLTAKETSCFDSARTGLTHCIKAPDDMREKNGVTTFDEDSVASKNPVSPDDAKLDDAKTTLTIPGSPTPIRSAKPIEAASIDWSPNKKRLTYAGALDPCAAIKAGKAAPKNDLFIWDADKKSATRIANATGTFETFWIDDDHLIYEGGVGKTGKLHLYDFTTKADTTLAPRVGAGLYGYAAMLCEPGEGEGAGETEPGAPDAD